MARDGEVNRDVIFPFFSGIPVFSNQIDHPRESRRSVEIFLDQYRGVGVFIPRDKFIRIGLFRSVNRPFCSKRVATNASHSSVAAIVSSKTSAKA